MSKNRYTANSWQEFSLKKDIEKIVATQNTNEATIDITIVTIVVSFIAVLVERFFEIINDKYEIVYFIVVLTISLIPIVIITFKWVFKRWKRNGLAVHGLQQKQMIDIFDNEVCYYIMMSESFYDLLNDQSANPDDNTKLFYYTQVCFYKNKAIDKLYFMKSKLEWVFENDSLSVVSSKKVALARLEIIINIINKLNIEIDSHNVLTQNLKKGEMLVDINNKYNELLQEIKDEIKSVFSVEM